MQARQQIDLAFDSMVGLPVKDDRALMQFPFFSLEKRPRREPLVYDDGDVEIRITGGELGIATIWDKDLLIYCASIINDRVERGEDPDKVSPVVRFAAHDFLRETRREVSGSVYERFADTLFRLQSTTIRTTIKADGYEDYRLFSWIASGRVQFHDERRSQKSGRRVMTGVEVELCQWMLRAIVKDRRVLTIDRAYFDLTMGLERRLYELARKHCGSQSRWTIGLPRLAEKCGSRQVLRQFKADVLRVAKRDNLPGYCVQVQDLAGAGADRTLAVFVQQERPGLSTAGRR